MMESDWKFSSRAASIDLKYTEAVRSMRALLADMVEEAGGEFHFEAPMPVVALTDCDELVDACVLAVKADNGRVTLRYADDDGDEWNIDAAHVLGDGVMFLIEEMLDLCASEEEEQENENKDGKEYE